MGDLETPKASKVELIVSEDKQELNQGSDEERTVYLYGFKEYTSKEKLREELEKYGELTELIFGGTEDLLLTF